MQIKGNCLSEMCLQLSVTWFLAELAFDYYYSYFNEMMCALQALAVSPGSDYCGGMLGLPLGCRTPRSPELLISQEGNRRA